MSRGLIILALFIAALLEAGGDAIVRKGIHSPSAALRIPFFVAGGCVLFGYSYVVNAPPWDFGRLLGVYVTFFFVIAQLISIFAFHQPPNRAVLFGGALVVCGGLVIALA